MADSDITVTSLTATGGVGVIVIAPITGGQSCLPYLQLAAIEIWEAATNNRNSASYIGDTIAGLTRQGLPASTTRYYWARARDVSGNLGDWFPSSATAGRQGSTSSVTPGPNSIGTDELKDDAVTGPKVKDGAVTQTKIANAAIVNAHIGDAQITNAKIANLAANKITAGILGADVVYGGEINADNITSGSVVGRSIRTSNGTVRCEMEASENAFYAFNYSSYIKIGGVGSRLIEAFSLGSFAALIYGNNNVPEIPMFAVSNNGSNGLGAVIGSRGTNAAHGARIMGKNWYQAGDGQDATTAPGGSVVLGVAAGGGGWAAFSEKGGYGPFTGGHDAFIMKDEPTEIGDIVCDLKVVSRNGVDDTVTEVYVAEDDADPAAVGVVSRRVEFEPGALMGALPKKEGRTRLREILAEKYDRLAINSVGEGQINVCGRGGNIRAGDLIMTSTLRGKGQRQPDGIVRNYTVAKAREDVTFSGPDDVKRCACIYHAG